MLNDTTHSDTIEKQGNAQGGGIAPPSQQTDLLNSVHVVHRAAGTALL